jgi:hypothetical protein
MTTTAEQPAFELVEEEPPEVDTLRGMFQNAGVRNYLFAGLAALAMISLILLQQGSDIGALLLLLVGAAGMILRWPATPTLFLVVLLWFLMFPFGLPPAYESHFDIQRRHFAVADVLLAFSIVVYLACHHRVYGLTEQVMPQELRFGRKRKPTRRPVELIRRGEIPRLLYLAAGAVIAGQLIWLLATSLEIDVNADFPLVSASTSRFGRRRPSEELSLWYTRLLILLGIGFFGTLLARLVFGYWRLRTISAAEGGMMLQDAGWNETRRERSRIEYWRDWGRQKPPKAQ